MFLLECPAARVTPFHREAWALFRLAHHRSPDVPGQPWRRIIGYDELAALPARTLDAWDVMEQETYLLAQDLRDEQRDKQQDKKP